MDITLQGFLLWLGTVGGSGTVVSFILEQVDWFQSLSEKGRRWVSFSGMALLGILSHLVLTYVPQDILFAIAPYFVITASAFVSVFSGQILHKFLKKESK